MRKLNVIRRDDERQGKELGNSCVVASSCDNSVVAGHESAGVVWEEDPVVEEEEWKGQERSVTLTNSEWGEVEWYLISEVNDIKEHLVKLGDNVSKEYWLEKIDKIQEIRKKIQERS